MTTATSARPTLIDHLWRVPDRSAIRMAILALLGSLFLWASAKAQVPMWPVPMTMQSYVVLVIGMAYGARLAAATVALYLDRKSTRLNSSHIQKSRMPSSA